MLFRSKTPLDVAVENKRRKVAEVLQNASGPFFRRKVLASLPEAYSAVVRREVSLNEDLIRRVFIRKNVRGIRDLWDGHKLLEIAQRLGKIPKDMDHYDFMCDFYHGIVGKLHTKQEIDATRRILTSAEKLRFLRGGRVSAILGDLLTVADISESIGPVIFDLCCRVQNFDEIGRAHV